MVSGDWIKLHRRITESGLFADDWLTRLWIWCLTRANYAPQTFYGATIDAGEFVTSMENAAEVLGKSKSTIWRGLQKMSSPEYDCLTLRLIKNAKRQYTVVTINNWQTYQSTEIGGETGAELERKGSEKGAKQIEERKKERRNTKTAFVEPTAEEVGQYCLSRGNKVDPEAFVDFYTAKGWLVGSTKMKDWKAAVRTWEKRNQTTGSSGSTTEGGNHKPKILPVGDPELLAWRP